MLEQEQQFHERDKFSNCILCIENHDTYSLNFIRIHILMAFVSSVALILKLKNKKANFKAKYCQ